MKWALVLAALTTFGLPQEQTLRPITGRILLPSGKPVAMAKVFLCAAGTWESRILAEAESGNDGSFKLDYTLKLKRGDPSPTLAVVPQTGAIAFAPVAGWKNGSEIQVHPATELRATFLDLDRGPAAGIKIAPYSIVRWEPLDAGTESAPPGQPIPSRRMRSFLVLPEDLAERLAKTTNEKGEVTLGGLPPGASTRIQVLDDRYAQLTFSEAQIELVGGATATLGPIPLRAGAVLSGTIFDAEGKPFAGIRVGAQGAGQSHEGWGDAVTDSKGRYSITRLMPNEYNVALDFQMETDQKWTAVAHEKVIVKAGERRAGLDFRLIEGGLIIGRVTRGGKPLSEVHVGVYGPAHPRSGAWVQTNLTDSEGRYRLRVPPGKQWIYLAGGPSEAGELPISGRDAEVSSGKETVVNFELH